MPKGEASGKWSLEEHNETKISFESNVSVLAIVAHPDDETLWLGGTILMHPEWNWHILSLCGGENNERRTKFHNAVRRLDCRGTIRNLDDGLEQLPLQDFSVQGKIMEGLADTNYDLIITHSPFGEYTRHLRHEEVGSAVLNLWASGELHAKELWLFAYSDSQKKHYPKAIYGAHIEVKLPTDIWLKKLGILQEAYGFSAYSWEAMTTPKVEAFWRLEHPTEVLLWHRDSFAPPVDVPETHGKGLHCD